MIKMKADQFNHVSQGNSTSTLLDKNMTLQQSYTIITSTTGVKYLFMTKDTRRGGTYTMICGTMVKLNLLENNPK